MSYTVVGMFPSSEDADRASAKLSSNNFMETDYNVSRYRRDSDLDNDRGYEYDEDEKTGGFWNWLFGDKDEDRKRYSYAGTKSNVVTVYTDDLDRAEKARDIMNDMGAIDVNDFSKEYFPQVSEYVTPGDNSVVNRARIVNKARNNEYTLGPNREYTFRQREGIQDTMDSRGDL